MFCVRCRSTFYLLKLPLSALCALCSTYFRATVASGKWVYRRILQSGTSSYVTCLATNSVPLVGVTSDHLFRVSNAVVFVEEEPPHSQAFYVCPKLARSGVKE